MAKQHPLRHWLGRLFRWGRPPQPVEAQSRGPASNQAKFNKFTEQARQALSNAQKEAEGLKHNYVGTEHLLLGLIRERDGIAGQALARLEVDADIVRRRVVFIIGERDREVGPIVGLNASARRAIELAVDEARRMGHHYLGTEHLLLGLLRERDGLGAFVLRQLGFHLETARQTTLDVLRERGGDASR